GGLVAHDVDLLAQQIVHGGAGTLVGNGEQVDAQGVHEHGAAQMAGGADAGIGKRDLVFVGLDVFDQLGDVVREKVGACDDGHGHVEHQADGFEALGLVAGVLVQRLGGREADVDRKSTRLN